MLRIVIGEDGEIVKDDFKEFNLTDTDKRLTKQQQKEVSVLDFVGFIVEKDKMLVVFPKHFFDNYKKNENTQENIKLLYNTIRKYILINKTKDIAKKYIGYEKNYESDYPFEPFYKIYEYYTKYGIFRKENEEVIKGINGKISWKKTIQKSDTMVSNGNLLYLPIFSKIKNHKYDFISECMTFVINHTIETFPYFLELKPILSKNEKIDFLSNIDYTLRQLYQLKNSLFKDYQKHLLDSLIDFFEQYRKIKKGGSIHFKINYFNLIWEELVANYLNKSFIGIDESTKLLLFDNDLNNVEKRFKKETFNIDISKNTHTIQPDHYYIDNEKMYIFDSKYYEEIGDLNYKQLAYTLILGNSKIGANKLIYSALLLPGKNENGYHLQLDEPYQQLKDGCNYIIEQFLDVKLLMEKYQ